MANQTMYPANNWESLKAAIATSSGFKRWQQEVKIDQQPQEPNLDNQVRSYLKETLATLAY